MFNTPILFIVFNRPDVTQLVFDEIKKIKPAQLFISADATRDSVPHEKTYCDQEKKGVISNEKDKDSLLQYDYDFIKKMV
jgi:hypothetical protein